MDEDLANALNYYAEVLRYNGDFRSADRLLNEAQPSFERYGKSDVRLGEYYSNRAAVLAALGQYATAMDYYNLAAQVGEHIPQADHRARLRLLAMVDLNKAQLFKSQRQFSEARAMCDQALAVSDTATWLSPEERARFQIPFRLTDASLLVAEAEQASSELQPTAEGTQQQLATAQQCLRQAREIAVDVAGGSVSNDDELNVTFAKHLAALANFGLARLCGDQTLPTAKSLWGAIARTTDEENVPALRALRAGRSTIWPASR